MRLNFWWSVELGLNLALETQRKGNSANKASRSSSDKSACVSWLATETTILDKGNESTYSMRTEISHCSNMSEQSR